MGKIEFLRPFHSLSERELNVTAAFLKCRYDLSKAIKDPHILDKVTMSEDTKKKVREICGISKGNLQVIMTKLRKIKVIENGKINPKFVPKLDEDAKSFQLLLSFDLK
jgi:hypothetical protein